MNPLDIFIPILINPLVNILLAFYKVAEFFHLPGPLGWSIILLTIFIRLAVYPFFAAQLNHQKKLNELKPHLAEIKRKHGKDPKRHREEQAKLYKERGFNPAAGCLPMLIQLPILLGLYNVFLSILNKPVGIATTHINSVAYASWLHITSFNENFLGVSLATSPAHSGVSILILIPVLTAFIQFILAKMTVPLTPPKTKEKDPSFEDTLAQTSSMTVYILPIMFAYFAYSFPVGLALYYNVSNIFAIIQQYLIIGSGGLAKWLPVNLTKLK